jgi:hypothetical protein
VGLQRSSQVHQRAEEMRRSSLSNLRSSLKLQDMSEREFEQLCDEFKQFVKFTTHRLEMQHVDFPAESPHRALDEWNSDKVRLQGDLDARVAALKSKAKAAEKAGADVESEMAQMQKLRLALLNSMDDIESEIRDRVRDTSVAQKKNVLSDGDLLDVLDRFDHLVKEFVKYARDTGVRIEKEYLEERSQDSAQSTLAVWTEDYREIDRQTTTRFDELEQLAEASDDSQKKDFASMLRYATVARMQLLETVREVEEELKNKLRNDLEGAMRSMDSNGSVASERTATFDSDAEEQEAVQREIVEKKKEEERRRSELEEMQREQEETKREEERRKEAEEKSKKDDILENQRQLEAWLAEKKPTEEEEEKRRQAESAQRELEAKMRREEEEEMRRERQLKEQEERWREQEIRVKEDKEKEEKTRREEEERLQKKQEEDLKRDLEERLRFEQAELQRQEEEEMRRKEERDALRREEEQRRKAQEEEEGKRRDEQARLESEQAKKAEERARREREIAAKEARNNSVVVAETKAIDLNDLERRVAEAERKREEKKLAAAKSPRRIPVTNKDEEEAARQLKRR